MLMTSPITELQIVLGKFFAGLTLYAMLMAPTLIYHVYISRFSDPSFPWRILGSSYLGILLLGAVLISLGLLISSLTESQIIAGVGTFAAALLLWIINSFAPGPGTILGQVLQYLSVIQHYESFTRGVIDTTSLIFYVSFTILCLFLTLQSLNSMRWRRA
jgi:ABC-2 type transport system permease protein